MDGPWPTGSQSMYNNINSSIGSIATDTTGAVNNNTNVNTNINPSNTHGMQERPSPSMSSSSQINDPMNQYAVPYMALGPRMSRRSPDNLSEAVPAIAAYLSGQADVVFDSNLVASHYRTAVQSSFEGSQQPAGSGNFVLPAGVPDAQSIIPLTQSIEYIIRHPPQPAAQPASSSGGSLRPQPQLPVEMTRMNTVPMSLSEQFGNRQLSAGFRADVEHDLFKPNIRQTSSYPTYFESTVGSFASTTADPHLQSQSRPLQTHMQPATAIDQSTWSFPPSNLPAYQEQGHALYQSQGQSSSQPSYLDMLSMTYPSQPTYRDGSPGQGLGSLSADNASGGVQQGYHHHPGFNAASINDTGLSSRSFQTQGTVSRPVLDAHSQFNSDQHGRVSSPSSVAQGKMVDRRRSGVWTDPGASPVMPLVSIGESARIATPQSSPPTQGRRKGRKASSSLPIPSTGTYIGRVEEMIPWNIKVTAGDPRKTHVCPVCRRGFARRFNLKAHMLTHDPMRPKPFQCQSCEKRFSRGHDLDRHHQSIHPDVIKAEPSEHTAVQPSTDASTPTAGPSAHFQSRSPSSSPLSSPERSQDQVQPQDKDKKKAQEGNPTPDKPARQEQKQKQGQKRSVS